MNSPMGVQLRTQEADLQRQQAELAQTLGERHPELLKVRVQLREIEQKIPSGSRSFDPGDRDDLTVLTAREHSIENDIKVAQGKPHCRIASRRTN